MASSDRDYKDYSGELWDQLEVHLQEGEDHSFDQDESTLPSMPGPLFSTPWIPTVKQPSTSMSQTLTFPCQSAFPIFISGPLLSPSVTPVKPHLHLFSPMWPIIPGPRTEYQPQVSPPLIHMQCCLPKVLVSQASE